MTNKVTDTGRHNRALNYLKLSRCLGNFVCNSSMEQMRDLYTYMKVNKWDCYFFGDFLKYFFLIGILLWREMPSRTDIALLDYRMQCSGKTNCLQLFNNKISEEMVQPSHSCVSHSCQYNPPFFVVKRIPTRNTHMFQIPS